MALDLWLEIHAPGYDCLSNEERATIKDFALLWSLFESNVLNGNGDANRILAVVTDLGTQNRLTLAPFAASIAYFFARYHDGTDVTPYFDGLRLRKNDHPGLVKQVLSKHIRDDVSTLVTLLIIIYRLRNNLLHGHKWSYEIRGQLENFQNANAALMAYIETYP